jgi:di/tricarboxylate transporter
MTPDILLTFAILFIAVTLFLSGRLRMDLVAVLVMASLALTGLLTPAEALSGFSNPVVITVIAVFVLSAGLARTGVATRLGQQMLRLSGNHERRLIVVIMLIAGLLSGIMNNVGVAALLLPVVMDLARRTKTPPSRLLMPLAVAALLGGLMTLIGTPPNLIVSETLHSAGFPPFGFFSFTPVGVVVLLAGIGYMLVIGRRLLPVRDPEQELRGAAGAANLESLYGLKERLHLLRIDAASPLVGKTLAQSRLGLALGVNVVGVLRHGQVRLAPGPHDLLLAGDRLIVEGKQQRLQELNGGALLASADDQVTLERLVSGEIRLVEATLSPASSLVGRTLAQINFRQRYGANVLGLQSNGELRRTDLQDIPLQAGNRLVLQGPRDLLDTLAGDPDFAGVHAESAHIQPIDERLMALRIPEGSSLIGRTLVESRLGRAFDLVVLGIVREGATRLLPSPDEVLQANDTLLIEGSQEDLQALHGLQALEVEPGSTEALEQLTLESEEVAMAEVVLSPHTGLAGWTLREIHFRDKYGLTVLAIWRAGRPYRTGLGEMPLQFGDALLVFGPRNRLPSLGSDRDFIVLTQAAQQPARLDKMPAALLILAAMLLVVIPGWVSVPIAALTAAALMILAGCLTMDEAYQAIEWRAVFLISGMLALGLALQQTGAAELVAATIVGRVGGASPYVIAAIFYILAMLATQAMPTQAVAVLLAPIVLDTALGLGISPQPLLMLLAVAVASSALSPVAHPANVLVMGPGGYRFDDFLKVGIPLALLILVVSLLFVPLLWPF